VHTTAIEIIETKIIIEWNGVEIVVDGKVYSLWNIEVFNMYLCMLTALKRKEFFVWMNGAEWNERIFYWEKKHEIHQSTNVLCAWRKSLPSSKVKKVVR
jgi:hypothetical protein